MEIENHIEEVRAGVLAAFSEQNVLPDRDEEFVSPGDKFRIRRRVYRQAVEKHLNWFVSKIEVRNGDDQIISSFLIDSDDFFYHWLFTQDNEYLLYAENLCGGNSVLNLRTGKIQSYSDGTDGFISCAYFPSPQLKHIAVEGCFWGTDYFVRVFDTARIDSLPWPMICDVEIPGAGETDVIWVDECTIRVISNDHGIQVVSEDTKIGG